MRVLTLPSCDKASALLVFAVRACTAGIVLGGEHSGASVFPASHSSTLFLTFGALTNFRVGFWVPDPGCQSLLVCGIRTLCGGMRQYVNFNKFLFLQEICLLVSYHVTVVYIMCKYSIIICKSCIIFVVV